MAILRGILLGIFCFTLPVAAQQKDDPKCKDHPLFSRMPDYWIHGCTQNEFDAYAFTVGKGKTEQVEGRLWKISYYPQAALKSKPSELQIMRNFEKAAKRIGGSILYSEKSRETVKLANDGKEVWVEITTEFTGKYGLTIPRVPLEQNVIADPRLAHARRGDFRPDGYSPSRPADTLKRQYL